MALAETLKVIPVLVQRVKLATGLPFVILAMALGKAEWRKAYESEK